MLQVVLSDPDEGTEKQEKLCWKYRTAVILVVPAARSYVGHHRSATLLCFPRNKCCLTLFGERE